MRNNTKDLLCRSDLTIIARFFEMDSHLFLTLETLSAASCLASFSLSNLSFLVQARIALIKPGHKSETEKFPPVPHTVNLLFEIILFYPILILPSALALDNVSETNQSSWLQAPKNCLNMLFSWNKIHWCSHDCLEVIFCLFSCTMQYLMASLQLSNDDIALLSMKMFI